MADIGYDLQSLERGIIQAKKNIRTFEDAIAKERETIKEYRFMADTIRRKNEVPKKIVITLEQKDGDKC